MKLKFVLPLAQIVLAIVLDWRSLVWDRAVRAISISDMPGFAPFATLGASINGPIVFVNNIFVRLVLWNSTLDVWKNYLLGRTVWAALVGLLWYWTALNLDSWRQRRAVVMFTWPPLRLVGDLLLIVTGVVWGILGIVSGAAWSGVPYVTIAPLHVSPYLAQPWQLVLLRAFVVTFSLSWSFALIFPFGRDFLHYLRSKEQRTALSAKAR
jgi:hypothetical protein